MCQSISFNTNDWNIGGVNARVSPQTTGVLQQSILVFRHKFQGSWSAQSELSVTVIQWGTVARWVAGCFPFAPRGRQPATGNTAHGHLTG